MLKVGDSVLMHNLSGGNPIPHLWFLLTTPRAVDALCIIASLTTLRNSQDQTVVLNPSDHPFIVKPSCIFYTGAILADARQIEQRLSEKLVRLHHPCTPEVLKIVQAGLLASPFTPKKIVSFYRSIMSTAG